MAENDTPPAELDLAFFLDFVLRRSWIIAAIWAAVLAATAAVTYTTRPVYEASAMIIIEKERGAGAVYANGSMVESKNDDYYQTQYKLLQSNSLMEKVYASLHMENSEEFGQPHGVRKLQTATLIAPMRGTRLVYVKVQSFDPQAAARIANAISDTFVSENLSNQLFISKEVLQTLQVNRSDPNARRMYESLPTVVGNPLVQGLRSEYVKLESRLAEQSEKVTERHPAMIALKSNMIALKKQIESETDKVVQSLKTELSGQLKGNNVRVIDAAQVPEYPIKPDPRKNMLLGLLGGLLLGILIAYGVEMMDQSVRTQADVEDKLRLPFLGSIPFNPQKAGERPYQSLLVHEPSLTSESFRNLRTMLDFATVSEKSNILLVTSSVQDEGKTYVSSCLAVALAQLGEDVLLISGDIRRPKLSKNFHLSSEHGLSDFLARGEKVDELEGLAQKTDIPNLHVLDCGTRPPNPSELLNTPRLEALIEWSKARFERVIVDCTPMFPVNDTLLWGRHVPAAIVVARYGKTHTPLILDSCRKIKAGGIKILGVVVNAAKSGGLGYSSYGYYHQQYHEQADLKA